MPPRIEQQRWRWLAFLNQRKAVRSPCQNTAIISKQDVPDVTIRPQRLWLQHNQNERKSSLEVKTTVKFYFTLTTCGRGIKHGVPLVGKTQHAASADLTTFEIPGFRCGVNIFALLRCYAAQICSCRRFGTTYTSHFQGPAVQDTFRGNLSIPFSGSSNPRDVSGQPTRPIFSVKQSKRRFGTTYPSHFQGPAIQETFRDNLPVPFSVSSSLRDVSGQPIRPIFRV